MNNTIRVRKTKTGATAVMDMIRDGVTGPYRVGTIWGRADYDSTDNLGRRLAMIQTSPSSAADVKKAFPVMVLMGDRTAKEVLREYMIRRFG